MDESEILIEALGQIPALVDAAQAYKESNEKTISTLAPAVKQRPKAVIPPTEISKVTTAVAQTQCALPDTDDLIKKIAEEISPLLHEEIFRTICEHRIELHHEHKHTHYSLGNLWEIVEDKTKKWIFGLACAVFVLLVGHAFGIAYILESELFLGKKCYEIYSSEYVTKEEQEAMRKDLYMVSVYPEKYRERQKALRLRIRENKSILKARKKQAKHNKGKFSTTEKIDF